jgi:riboflavin synthase
LERYVVWKGSITLDGISLTVARLDGLRVGVAIIPHTYENTNLCGLRTGDPVNVEADVLAKYLEKLLEKYEFGNAHNRRVGRSSGITMERLIEEGF